VADILPIGEPEEIEELFPDEIGAPLDEEDALDIATEGLEDEDALLSDDDDFEIEVDGEATIIGRSLAFNFPAGKLFSAGQGPQVVRGAAAISAWVEKCIRTQAGAHEACDPAFGLPEPLSEYAATRGAGLEAALREALTFHPAITDIREYTLTEGTTPDGADDALAVNFNVVLDDDTELPISTELGTGEVILG